MPRKIRGFSRVESADARGWLVRIKRGDDRKSRFISDTAHGGKRKSMQVAQELYEEWVAEMPPPETSLNKVGVRNSSGVVGVHHSHDVDMRFPGCNYDSYVASWLDEDGKRKNIRFSCNKYGDDAFELACIAREKQLSDRDKVMALLERRKKSGKRFTVRQPAGGKKKAVSKKATTKKTARKKVASKSLAKSKTSATKKKKKTAARKK